MKCPNCRHQVEFEYVNKDQWKCGYCKKEGCRIHGIQRFVHCFTCRMDLCYACAEEAEAAGKLVYLCRPCKLRIAEKKLTEDA